MRRFSLKNPDFEIPHMGNLMWGWSGLETGVATQLAFEEQYLKFHRYLLDNLQSTPTEYPDWSPRALPLSLRGGAIKAYVVFACSMIEGALAAWGAQIGLERKSELFKHPLGALLKAWQESGTLRNEIAPIWKQLELLKNHRNFIHLGREASDPDAYWKNIVDKESELITAVDEVVKFLSRQCVDEMFDDL
jgi:hypothetical protein